MALKLKKEALKKLSPEQVKKLIEAKKKFDSGQVISKEGKKTKKSTRIDKEKLLYLEEQRNRESKEYKKQVKLDNEKLKLNRKRKETFQRMLKSYADEIRSEIIVSFTKLLDDMKKEGKLYGSKFMSLPMKDVRLEKLNTLGKKGWKFAFEYDDKFYLTKEMNLED